MGSKSSIITQSKSLDHHSLGQCVNQKLYGGQVWEILHCVAHLSAVSHSECWRIKGFEKSWSAAMQSVPILFNLTKVFGHSNILKDEEIYF